MPLKPISVSTQLPTSDERSLAMLYHLLAFVGYVMPFGNIFGPLAFILSLFSREQIFWLLLDPHTQI